MSERIELVITNDLTSEVFEALDGFGRRTLEAFGTPGMVVALTGREELLGCRAIGSEDPEGTRPLAPDALFEMGSVGKPFTCALLLQLAEEGRLDPGRPVREYLPWFEVESRFEPITIRHLMDHTGGIIGRYSDTVPSRFEVSRLLRSEVAHAPGTKFHYSNIGYKVLGFLLEEVTGRSYCELVSERILRRLGMDRSEPCVTRVVHRRLTPGYERLFNDRPAAPDDPLTIARAVEYRTADGSPASTAADMTAFVRMLLRRGEGDAERVLSRESCDEMMRASIGHAWQRPELSYGYGLIVLELEGRACVGHGGETVGHRSLFLADPASGFGVVVCSNGPSDLFGVGAYGLTLAAAVAGGGRRPDAPKLPDPSSIENAADFDDVLTCPETGREIVLRPEGDRLVLETEGRRVDLESRGPDCFFVRDPELAGHFLRVHREGGLVTEATHGGSWYVTDRYRGPRTFERPPEWERCVGHFRSHNPWFPSFRIVARKGSLILVEPSGAELELLPTESGRFRVGAPDCPEWLAFDSELEGVYQRAEYSGSLYHRVIE